MRHDCKAKGLRSNLQKSARGIEINLGVKNGERVSVRQAED
jgi:hypothetical protein